MAAKTNQTQPLRGQAEVTAQGVTPKSQRGAKKPSPAAGTVVVHKHERRGKHWLRTFVSGVLVADLVVGEVMIYTAGLPDDLTIHAMWAYGIAHVAAIGVIQFVNKLE